MCSKSERFKPYKLSSLFLVAALMLTEGALAAEARVQIVNDQQEAMDNVVVIIEPEGHALAAASTGMTAQVDQVDRQFVPHVQLVQAGTEVSFPNFDDIRHHVYSFSDAKRFELPLYKGTPSDPVLFEQPGIVILACNIHDWMLGYLYVTDSPWHALTDQTGVATLTVPEASHYLVRVWHPSLGADNAGIEEQVSADQLNNITLSLADQSTSGGRRQLRRSTRYP
ncbi:methylamine utilization protein [Nitrincola sp. MINF-07-Sa-05]|uniref:methylamine utilization protein n=1 Tax=Nitrincola salilacus TaxID=3400273 RepID=UPI0039182CFF